MTLEPLASVADIVLEFTFEVAPLETVEIVSTARRSLGDCVQLAICDAVNVTVRPRNYTVTCSSRIKTCQAAAAALLANLSMFLKKSFFWAEYGTENSLLCQSFGLPKVFCDCALNYSARVVTVDRMLWVHGCVH